MYGGDRISQLRKELVEQSGSLLSPAEFHYALLSQGTVGLDAAEARTRRFAQCVQSCRSTADQREACEICDDRSPPMTHRQHHVQTQVIEYMEKDELTPRWLREFTM